MGHDSTQVGGGQSPRRAPLARSLRPDALALLLEVRLLEVAHGRDREDRDPARRHPRVGRGGYWVLGPIGLVMEVMLPHNIMWTGWHVKCSELEKGRTA